MAIDPRIALLTKVPNYSDTFYKGLMQGQQVSNTAQEQPVRNRLLDAQATGAEQEVRQRNWDYEFDSVLRGTLQLENIVGTEGDLTEAQSQQAIDFLTKRTQEIQQRGGVVDDTQLAIDLLREGNVDKLRQDISNIKSVGVQTGRLKGLKDGIPSGVQEFNTLVTAAGGDDDLRAKAARIELGIDQRAGTGAAPQVVDVGGVPHIFDRNKQKLVEAEIDGKAVTTDSVAASEGKIAATKKANESAIDMSNKAIEQLGSVRTSIANYDDAIKSIDDGAATGAVQSFFPSVKAASVELDNIRGRLGLDIIGGTTFGALSESELKFALDTALPTKLDGPELRAWLVRKKAAQEKLSQELESAAIYLGKPGNTPAGYLEFRRNSIAPEEIAAGEVNDLVNKYAN
jgi:hypothetical protein